MGEYWLSGWRWQGRGSIKGKQIFTMKNTSLLSVYYFLYIRPHTNHTQQQEAAEVWKMGSINTHWLIDDHICCRFVRISFTKPMDFRSHFSKPMMKSILQLLSCYHCRVLYCSCNPGRHHYHYHHYLAKQNLWHYINKQCCCVLDHLL